MEVSQELKTKYDTQYSDKTEQWRKIGARGKAANIMAITEGMQFKNVIEVGAGDGNILSVLSEKKFCSDLTAVEISSSAIEQIKKKNIPGLSLVQQFDGYKLPFPDKSFDLAICSHVIEHVEYPRLLLKEIQRISRKQLFEVPIDFSFKVDRKFAHYNSYGHINIYTPALFNFLLYTVGFKVLRGKHALYQKEVIDFQYKSNFKKYLPVLLKRFVWKLFPVLMRIKPNTYTVLTE